jgi:hypothetical protein
LWEAAGKIANQEDVDDATLLTLQKQIRPTGVQRIDDDFRISSDRVRRMAQLTRQFNRQNSQLDVATLLGSERLVNSEGLEQANLTVLTVENMYAENMRQMDNINADYTTSINALVAPEDYRKKLRERSNQEMAQYLDVQLQMSEHIGTLIELVKQALAVCEKNLGHLTVKDHTLIFTDEQSLQTFNALHDKIGDEMTALQQIDDAESQRMLSTATWYRSKAMGNEPESGR